MKTLLMAAVMLGAITTGCCNKSAQTADQKDSTDMTTKAQFAKKYTNADFYKDGAFQQEVAKKAFLEMFEYYHYPMTPFLEQNIWFVDFGLGDFENCGMGGVFWVNDSVNGYFSHDIYLLPGQMIPEHKHVATKFPAKMESWMVADGWCYNFSEVGEPTPDTPAIPASQQATTISKNFVKQGVDGGVVNLSDKGVGTFHFLMAGPEGAIVHEYANYHDGEGLRFSNTKAKM